MSGPIEQPHVRPWATVLRVPTPAGIVWMKAAAPAFAHEARLLEVLGPLAPELMPRVLARSEEGWLLLEDAGERAREHGVDWIAVYAGYVALQRDAAAHVDELLDAGAPDNRVDAVADQVRLLLPWLPDDLAGALERRLPAVDDRLARLRESRLPVTIDHGDLHDGNVFVRDGTPRIIDWGDAAVAHPLFTLSVAEPEEAAACLAAWEDAAPRDELAEEAAIVEELRFLLRALNWHHVAEFGPPWSDHLVDRVARFVG